MQQQKHNLSRIDLPGTTDLVTFNNIELSCPGQASQYRPDLELTMNGIPRRDASRLNQLLPRLIVARPIQPETGTVSLSLKHLYGREAKLSTTQVFDLVASIGTANLDVIRRHYP